MRAARSSRAIALPGSNLSTSAALGRVANAINFVNATYSTARGHTLASSRLRVPEEQLADAYVRDMMGIPAHLRPATKPQLGAQMLAEMLGAGIEIPWLAADEVYGQDPGLRKLCEERGIGYVLGVPRSFRVTLPSGARIAGGQDPGDRSPAGAGRPPHAGPGPRATAATPGPGSPPGTAAVTC